jgi:hypothetical protein
MREILADATSEGEYLFAGAMDIGDTRFIGEFGIDALADSQSEIVWWHLPIELLSEASCLYFKAHIVALAPEIAQMNEALRLIRDMLRSCIDLRGGDDLDALMARQDIEVVDVIAIVIAIL